MEAEYYNCDGCECEDTGCSNGAFKKDCANSSDCKAFCCYECLDCKFYEIPADSVFKKWVKCMFHPESESCRGCIDRYTCIFYKEV